MDTNIKIVELEKIPVNVDMCIPQKDIIASTLETSRFFNEVNKSMYFKMRAYVWGHTSTVMTIKYPADWKQAFKERWFPSFLLKKYPIVYKTYSVDASIIYPRINVVLPDEQHFLKYHIKEDVTSCWDNKEAVVSEWKQYERKGMIEAKQVIVGERVNTTEISVSAEDRASCFAPYFVENNCSIVCMVVGGMIARNPDNPKDQWYINPEYFKKNYEEAER